MMELHMIRYDHRKHLEWLFEQMSSPKEQVMFIKNNNFNSIRDFDGWIQDNLKYFFYDFFVFKRRMLTASSAIYSIHLPFRLPTVEFRTGLPG